MGRAQSKDKHVPCPTFSRADVASRCHRTKNNGFFFFLPQGRARSKQFQEVSANRSPPFPLQTPAPILASETEQARESSHFPQNETSPPSLFPSLPLFLAVKKCPETERRGERGDKVDREEEKKKDSEKEMCLSRRREEKSACMTQQRRRVTLLGWGGAGGHTGDTFVSLECHRPGGGGPILVAVFLTSCRCGSASAVTYFLLFSARSLAFLPAFTALISPSRPFFAPFFLALLLEVRRECRSSASVL